MKTLVTAQVAIMRIAMEPLRTAGVDVDNLSSALSNMISIVETFDDFKDDP